MNLFQKLKASLRLWEAVRRANEAYRLSGNRYYVMPGPNKGRLFIMDRKNFRKMKQKHYISNDVFVSDLERECFYCTPYSNGTGTLPNEVVHMKRKQFYEWYAKSIGNHE